jgi:hypothetical protein
MQDNRRRDWLGILDEFGPQLDESAASERLDVFLMFLGDEVGWPASEYWLRQGDSLTQVAESHVESVVLDTFERHQSTFVVNIDWTTVREIWPESDPDPRNVAWIKGPADSSYVCGDVDTDARAAGVLCHS